ncbi:hypothetical protein ACFVYE_03490 [Streptomyces sp. NPDC058239]|uniref:hypothetical protein n=1 Tax=unclassified Streptomyces TaxID=2593676 RepID=UPI00364DFE8D
MELHRDALVRPSGARPAGRRRGDDTAHPARGASSAGCGADIRQPVRIPPAPAISRTTPHNQPSGRADRNADSAPNASPDADDKERCPHDPEH